ncbi:hypothetical protein FACS1894172_13630 [Spirochaetia bacterium]|nr:hypothetical protein FACS1894172_13630 [Spirochaetia bacterium]
MALMQSRINFIFLCCIILLNACARKQPSVVLPWSKPEPEPVLAYMIRDYQGRSEGAEIPEWVAAYNHGGESEIESMDQYHDFHTFVANNAGANPGALELWMDGFKPELDFSLLVTDRMVRRLTSAAFLYPDHVYGAFFEAVVRAAADANYPDPVKTDQFWQLKKYVDNDREEYEFLILVCIDKRLFRQRIYRLFENLKLDPELTKDQAVAVRNIKARFFDQF